ncbi:MAG: DUF4199 domain-containing protein [Bacteroidota bacterium]
MSMLKVSFRYALFCAGFLVILFFVSGYFGSNPLIDLSQLFFDVMIIGVFIFFALKDYKMNFYDGYLHFWQGMTIGFFLYTIVALMFSLFLALFLWADPALLTAYKESAIAFLNGKRDVYVEQFGEEGFQVQLDGIESVTAMDLWLSSGVKKIIAGFFVTPVISIILRKKPKN